MGTRHLQTAFNPNKDANGLYQGGLGVGVSDANSSVWNEKFGYHGFLPTSVGVELGDSCGVSTHTVSDGEGGTFLTAKVPVFFGLKNFYGYLNRWERGLILSKNADNTSDVYIVPQLYSDYNVNSISGLLKVGTIPAEQSYIMQISMQNLCHKPTVVGGSSSTYYADYQYHSAGSGLRGSAVGGNANNGDNAGPEYLNANNGVTNTNGNYGSPLNFIFIRNGGVCQRLHFLNETGPHPTVKYTHQRKCW